MKRRSFFQILASAFAAAFGFKIAEKSVIAATKTPFVHPADEWDVLIENAIGEVNSMDTAQLSNFSTGMHPQYPKSHSVGTYSPRPRGKAVHQCPVCASAMEHSPEEWSTCWTCNSEFGVGKTHKELKAEWLLRQNPTRWQSGRVLDAPIGS